MTKPEHIPWSINGIQIIDGQGREVCLMGEPAQFAGDLVRMCENAAENAKHIVRAVNSHDKLVAAIDFAVSELASVGYPTNHAGEYDKDGEWVFADATRNNNPEDAKAIMSAFLSLRAARAEVSDE
jgi:hypothetical protein